MTELINLFITGTKIYIFPLNEYNYRSGWPEFENEKPGNFYRKINFILYHYQPSFVY